LHAVYNMFIQEPLVYTNRLFNMGGEFKKYNYVTSHHTVWKNINEIIFLDGQTLGPLHS